MRILWLSILSFVLFVSGCQVLADLFHRPEHRYGGVLKVPTDGEQVQFQARIPLQSGDTLEEESLVLSYYSDGVLFQETASDGMWSSSHGQILESMIEYDTGSVRVDWSEPPDPPEFLIAYVAKGSPGKSPADEFATGVAPLLPFPWNMLVGTGLAGGAALALAWNRRRLKGKGEIS